MTALPKSNIKAYFQTGDLPTQSNFSDLVDSYQNASTALNAIIAASAGANQIIYFTSGSAASPTNLGIFGKAFIAASTTAAAFNQLGATAIGTQLFTAATTAAAQAPLGLGTAALQNTGTSGNNIPLLNTGNTWSADQIFTPETKVTLGGGTDTAKLGGIEFISTNQTGNNGGSEYTMMSYTIPASSFNVNGQVLEFESAGLNSNNGNVKQLNFYFGGTKIFVRDMTVNAANQWFIKGKVIRSGSSQQIYSIEVMTDGTTVVAPIYGNSTETDTSAILFKCTVSAAGNTDVIQRYMVLKFNNN